MRITIDLSVKEFEELKDLILMREETDVMKEENEGKEENVLRYKVDDIVFEDYETVNRIRDDLLDAANRYGLVTVADYKDLSGVESKYIDNLYGWTVEIIRRVHLCQHNGGYKLALPLALKMR